MTGLTRKLVIVGAGFALAAACLKCYFETYSDYYSFQRYEDVFSAWALLAFAAVLTVAGVVFVHLARNLSRSSK